MSRLLVVGLDGPEIADLTGSKHLLEVNHAANVTVFPEIREAFLDLLAAWADPGPA